MRVSRAYNASMSIILFTDYGLSGPYVGLLKAVLQQQAPGIQVIDLMHDVPAFDAEAGAYLLARLEKRFGSEDVFLCVVDPGVGGDRKPLVMRADGKWYVGPDNGLLSVIAQRAMNFQIWEITWRPEKLSGTFHGRDLFAPIAAEIARGEFPHCKLSQMNELSVVLPLEARRIIYVDHFGNCMSGMHAGSLQKNTMLELCGRKISHAGTYSEVPLGKLFWYENSIGLLEVAVNSGSAADALGVAVGAGLKVL